MDENMKIRDELFKSVIGLSDEELNRKVDNDSWSIMQVLKHLYLIECGITKGILAELAKAESIEAENKPIHLAVDRSRKVKAAPVFDPSEDFTTLEEIQGKLAESRKNLIKVVREADEVKLAEKSFPHPVFGRLSLKQWIPFVGIHEKRHTAQIEEIKSKLTALT